MPTRHNTILDWLDELEPELRAELPAQVRSEVIGWKRHGRPRGITLRDWIKRGADRAPEHEEEQTSLVLMAIHLGLVGFRDVLPEEFEPWALPEVLLDDLRVIRLEAGDG